MVYYKKQLFDKNRFIGGFNMKRTMITLALCVTLGVSAMAKTINNVDLKEQITQNEQTLELNGAGIRTKYFLKLYVGSLYTITNTKDAEKIIQSQEPMTIKLNITSKMITTERLKDALKEGFETVEPKKLALIKDNVEKFDAVFTDKIELGDVYSFEAKDGIVTTTRNGKVLIVINDQAFKEALFGIWIGKNAVDKDLKKEMLGE
jgi:hypothetical protein